MSRITASAAATSPRPAAVFHATAAAAFKTSRQPAVPAFAGSASSQ